MERSIQALKISNTPVQLREEPHQSGTGSDSFHGGPALTKSAATANAQYRRKWLGPSGVEGASPASDPGVLARSALRICGSQAGAASPPSDYAPLQSSATRVTRSGTGSSTNGASQKADMAHSVVRDRDAGRSYLVQTDLGSAPSQQTLVALSGHDSVTFTYDSLPQPTTPHGQAPSDDRTKAETARRQTASELSTPHCASKMKARQPSKWLAKFVRRRASGSQAASRTVDVNANSIDIEVPSDDGGASDDSSRGSGTVEDTRSVEVSSSGTTAGFSLRHSKSVPSKGLSEAVPVVAHKKVLREFTHLKHVQHFKAHKGAIWKIAFDPMGAYMATAGQDCVVRVWENRRAAVEGDGNNRTDIETASSVPDDAFADWQIIKPRPKQEFRGHQDDIFDLSWSGSEFLLSASQDKTVRLWHLKQDGELKQFRHDAFVMAAVFHPVNATLFISCAWNGKVRLQQVQPPRVLDWKQTQLSMHNLNISCASISARGDRISVGCQFGRVRQYNVVRGNKLEQHAEFDVREKRKRKAGKDTPVNGLDTLPHRPDVLLVTSRDSRLRLYRGTNALVKYKGLHNRISRIAASFSPDGRYIVCGSDDGTVYIWLTDTEASLCLPPVRGSYTPSEGRMKSASFEAFKACSHACTVALFVPVVPDAPSVPPVPFSLATVDAKLVHESVSAQTGVQRVSGKSYASIKECLKACKIDTDAPRMSAAQQHVQREAEKLHAFGRIIAVASALGDIHLFENAGAPEWS